MLTRTARKSAAADAVEAEAAVAKALRPHQVCRRRHSPRLARRTRRRQPRHKCACRRRDFNLPGLLRTRKPLNAFRRQRLNRRNQSTTHARSKPLRCFLLSAPHTAAPAIRPWLRAWPNWNRCCAVWLPARCIVWTKRIPLRLGPAYFCFRIPTRSLRTTSKLARRCASAWEISRGAADGAPPSRLAADVRHSDSGLKTKLAEHLGISEAKVSQYMKDHCVRPLDPAGRRRAAFGALRDRGTAHPPQLRLVFGALETGANY